jgi:sec-independent protein translocase protein TatB
MFDFAWSEIALIGVVALVLIGPKDMPVAIKAVSDVVKKARRMAADLQGHVDEMVKDTSIAEVRQQINDIRNFDIRGEIERAVDSDGAIRASFTDDPFRNTPPAPPAHDVPEVATHGFDPPGDAAIATLPPPAFSPPAFSPPAFSPPAFVPPDAVAAVVAPQPPAFIPPGVTAPTMTPPGAPRA